MNRKIGLVAVVLALGYVLAAVIPAASAQKAPRATSTCSATYTLYSQCPSSTTTTTPSTTTTTPTTTTTTTPSTTTTTPPSTTTSVPATTTGSANPAVAPNTFTASASVAVGTKVATGATVTANHNGNLTIDDNGVSVTAPKGSTIQTAGDGSLLVSSTTATTGAATLVLVGGKAKSYYMTTRTGVSFGANHSKAQVLKAVTILDGTKKDPAKITKWNLARSQVLLTLSKATNKPTFKIKASIFEYTKAEIKTIHSHGVTKTLVALKVTTTAHKVYTFKMRIPITKTLTVGS